MKNIFELKPTERFRAWKDFRSSLEKLSDQEQLKETASYWGMVPMVSFYVDWDDHTTWATPWDLIHEGQMCPTAVAICMYHTLRLIDDGHWDNRIKLSLVRDSEKGMIMVVIADNKFVINYSHDSVTNKTDLQEIIEEYIYLDGKYKILRN